MPSEELFVEQLKTGVPAAYELLVERFEGPLYRYFLCDHRDHHTAQEQTAETFAELVRSLSQMRGDCGQLRAFVFATARHVQQRRWRRRRKRPLPLADAMTVSDPGPSPATVAVEREELERVLDAMGQLEESQRQVLLLRCVERLSIAEIAAALEMQAGTVKSHIHRGRLRLKQILVEKEAEHERSQ